VDFDDYFMSIAHAVCAKGTCSRRKVGAVAVRDRRILATGYNGALAKTAHCDHEQHQDPSQDPALVRIGDRWSCALAVHAEANVVSYAARAGIALEGCSIYCNTYPCLNCTKLMIAAGVRDVVFQADYANDPLVEQIAAEAGLVLARR